MSANSSCSVDYKPALIIGSSANGISLVTCLIAIALLRFLKLHRKVVYRLALYQVLAASELSLVQVLQVQFLNTNLLVQPYKGMCIATAYFLLQSQWVKVLLVVCVTVHLFSFAIFHKNLQKFELLYVLGSLLLSVIIAAIPLTTNTYGFAGSWCWIKTVRDDCSTVEGNAGLIEQFVLWFVPSMVILVITSSVMVAMVLVVARRSRLSILSEHSITAEHLNRKALNQLLPLAAYPVLFCIFNVLPFVNRLPLHKSTTTIDGLEVASILSSAFWGLSTAVSLLVHIVIVRCTRKKSTAFSYRTINLGNY